MEKSSQKYLAMIKVSSAGSLKLYDEIMKWKDSPITGVNVEEAYHMFGKWDFAVLFRADKNENALHFVGDVVRPIEGVKATRTIPIVPLKKWS